MGHDPLAPFDAVLLLSFGGPEGPDEVMPFLEHVTRGRGIPRDRLELVAEHYRGFGGVSPINAQNRALLAALEPALRASGSRLPLYWGNRNSAPWLRTVAEGMVGAGVRKPVVLVTSAYSSYSGCRQYREDLAAAFDGLAVDVAKVAQYYDAEGFIEANADAVHEALRALPSASRIVFVTHSIPVTADAARYTAQHAAVAEEVSRRVALRRNAPVLEWQLSYCSRSGAPGQSWLEPDINETLRALAAQGVHDVVVSPIGFVSDHMEVKFDLDTEALTTAQSLGMRMQRAATAGTHPAFVQVLVDLLIERAREESGSVARAARVPLPAPHALAVCAVDCCPNPRAARPALCGADA